ncbi:MAG TPA: WecB/TagA/CpsF family glycosyltransferase [Vicinamibacteria bacterium]
MDTPAPASPATGPPAFEPYSVLGVWVVACDPPSALAEVARWLRGGRRGYVCAANVHGVVEALRDPALRDVYNHAGLTVPDGMPLVWLGRLAGRSGVRRVYGPDLMLETCRLAAREGHRCYFYGGRPGVAEALAAEMTRRFPGLPVAGTQSPPFREAPGGEEEAAEEEAAVKRINAARTDVLFVGLGCPKQERWMARLRPALEAPVLMGVGAAFDFHTGRVRQAPAWLGRVGLEWLFRLFQEPRRLARRYLIGNTVFVAHTLLQKTGLRRYPPLAPPAGPHPPGDGGGGPAT